MEFGNKRRGRAVICKGKISEMRKEKTKKSGRKGEAKQIQFWVVGEQKGS